MYYAGRVIFLLNIIKKSVDTDENISAVCKKMLKQIFCS